MNPTHRRPLPLDKLRTFEAVARRLSFSGAADELFITQSAISRQIKALEAELGTALFNRGTRKVELTAAGDPLRQALPPALGAIDRSVRQIRVTQGRRAVRLSTFASFATLWLMPRLAGFQQQHPDIDIRISATDVRAELDDPDLDLLLRYDNASNMPALAERMFGELLTPVVSPWLLQQAASGLAPPRARPADLAHHALLEDDDHRPSTSFVSWHRWLEHQGLPGLALRRWVFVNDSHQQVQGALAGQGVALARMALIHESSTGANSLSPLVRRAACTRPTPTGCCHCPTPG